MKNNLPIDERQHSDYASYKTQLSKFEFVTSISCGASSSLTFALGFGYKPKILEMKRVRLYKNCGAMGNLVLSNELII